MEVETPKATTDTAPSVARRRGRWHRSCSATLAALAAVVLTTSTASAATGGYGPGGPSGPPPLPGAYTDVVIARTISSTGAVLVARVAGAIAAIDVAPNSFRGRVILKVTRPDLAGITSSLATLGWVNAEAVAGIGVDLLSPSGQPLAPALAKPVTVTLCGPAIGVAGEQVLALTGPTTATEVGATVDFHCVRFSVGADANLAVVNPRKGRGTPRAGESDSSLSLTAPSGPVGHEPVLGVAPSGSAAATVGEAPATAVASRQTGAGVGKVERDTGSRTVTPSGTSSGDASTRSVASAASLSVVEGGRGTGRATSATLWLGVLAIALFLAVVALIAIKRLRAARL